MNIYNKLQLPNFFKDKEIYKNNVQANILKVVPFLKSFFEIFSKIHYIFLSYVLSVHVFVYTNNEFLRWLEKKQRLYINKNQGSVKEHIFLLCTKKDKILKK